MDKCVKVFNDAYVFRDIKGVQCGANYKLYTQ